LTVLKGLSISTTESAKAAKLNLFSHPQPAGDEPRTEQRRPHGMVFHEPIGANGPSDESPEELEQQQPGDPSASTQPDTVD
jgi:hypothetical protein